MEVHNLVARLKTCRSDVRDLRLDIVHPEANVVHADLVQLADMLVRQYLWMQVAQYLYFGAGRCIRGRRVPDQRLETPTGESPMTAAAARVLRRL